MVASAAQYAMTAPNNNPRACQGWGFPDLRQLYDSRQQMFVVDETDVLQPGAVRAWQVDVAAAQPFLKACLNWNEPAGNPSAAASLINNLSLRVTSPSGQVYWGNHNLASSVWSLPGGSEDSINSIESVFVQTPSAGTWIVEVLATAIVLDNHIETAAVDADYGLVVLGGTGTFATVTQLGIGCAGVTLTASDRPILGSTFDLQTEHAPTNTAFGLSILATSTLPQPINLGSIGMPGCTLYQPLDLLTPFAIASGSGTTEQSGVHRHGVAQPIRNPDSRHQPVRLRDLQRARHDSRRALVATRTASPCEQTRGAPFRTRSPGLDHET